jgi:hypothetical protein
MTTAWMDKEGLSHEGVAGQMAIGALARAYMIGKGITPLPQSFHDINAIHVRRLADYFHVAVHEPLEPDVMRSYCVFRYEVLEQFLYLRSCGLDIERWDKPGQPYPNSRAMLTDLWSNFHLYYFPTYGEDREGGFGSGDAERGRFHPLLETAWYDRQYRPLPYNDAFRVIHDAFGHGRHGWPFGVTGEENAWISHAHMFSPEAWMALAVETRAQTAWFTFGPHLRRSDGAIPKKGDSDYVSLNVRPYAEQKAIWLSQDFYVPP